MELIQSPSVISPKHFDNVTRFKNSCLELSVIASQQGINLAPVNANGLTKFQTLTGAQQSNIIAALENYVSQIRSALKEKVDITGDNCKHAWWAIAKMGLRAPNGLFEKIKSTDIIEIYNQDSIQVFRSFEMFKYLSYSLSEIFAYDWIELYSRDEFMAKRMLKIVEDVLSGKVTGVVHSNFPPHIVQENFSEKKCWAKMEHSIMSALYHPDGAIGGFISSFRILEHGTADC